MAAVTPGGWSEARPGSFWLDSPYRPAPRPPLTANQSCELAMVGGGYSGLWTALLAKERNPDRDVVLIEGERIGWAASGRNGGFCAASLTHGEANGRERFPPSTTAPPPRPGEPRRDRGDRRRYGIDCDFGAPASSTSPRATRWTPPRGERRVPRPGRGAGRGRLADLPGRHLGPRGLRDLDPARLAWGLAARGRVARRADLRGHPGPRPGSRRRRRAAPRPSTASCARARSRSAPTRSRRCCGGCDCSRSRSTTTSW